MGKLLGGSGQHLRRVDERMRHGDTSRRGRGSMLYPAEGEGSTGRNSAPVKALMLGKALAFEANLPKGLAAACLIYV